MLFEKLHAIRNADPEQDLAELLGVEPGRITWGPHGVTIGDETISLEDARRAIAPDPEELPQDERRRVRIEDL